MMGQVSSSTTLRVVWKIPLVPPALQKSPFQPPFPHLHGVPGGAALVGFAFGWRGRWCGQSISLQGGEAWKQQQGEEKYFFLKEKNKKKKKK